MLYSSYPKRLWQMLLICPPPKRSIYSTAIIWLGLGLLAAFVWPAGQASCSEPASSAGPQARTSEITPILSKEQTGHPAFIAPFQTITQTLEQPSGWSGGTRQGTLPQDPVIRSDDRDTGQRPDSGSFAALPDWPLLVWDDFSDPASGWHLKSANDPAQGTYRDGMLEIAFETEAFAAQNVFSVHQFDDFRLDVDVQTAGYDINVFYELFLRYGGRYEDRAHYYYVVFRQDAAYQIFLRDGPEVTTLQDLTQSACYLTGPDAVNHLTVVAQGPRFDFYANGCFLTSITDDRLAEGDIGFGAGGFEGPAVVNVRFDNFRVYAPRPLKPARFGDVFNTTISKEELIAAGQFADVWPYPSGTSMSQFPGGTKRVELYVPYEGMTSKRQIREVALIDGQEVWSEGPLPWSEHVRDERHLGFGVYMRTFKMRQGSDLPAGHWEVRVYVDEVLVARTFFSIGADTPPPTPEPLQISTAPAIGHPALPPLQDITAQAGNLCAQVRWDEGLAAGQLAIAVAPKSPETLQQVAALYAQTGHTEWVRMLEQTALNLTGIPPAAAMVQAQPGGSQLETGPAGVCLQEAQGAYDRGEYQGVIDLLARCLSEGGGADEISLYDYLGRAYYQLGWPARDEHSFARATEAFNRALALNPGYAPACDYLGRIQYFRKDYENALTYLSKATDLDATLPNPYQFRGRIAYDRGQYTEAVPLLRAYLDNGGTVSEAFVYELIGRAEFHANWSKDGPNRFDAAIEALNKALAINPDRDPVYDYLGRIYYFLDNYEQSLPYLEKANQLNGDAVEPYYFRGRILYKNDQYEQAISLLQSYLDRGGDSNTSGAHIYLGWSYYELQQYVPAEQAFLKALELTQTSGTAYGGLAWVYRATNRCPQAIPLFQKAVELNPGFDGWKQGLAGCQGQ